MSYPTDVSSIEHGDTRPFSYVMDHEAIFQYVEFLVLLYFGIFLWLRCEVVFPMHVTMVWTMLMESKSQHRVTPLMFV